MKENIMQQFYLETSMFTDLGKYKSEAIDLWGNKCNKNLKKLCQYLMNATVHRVVVQWALEGKDVSDYGDFDYIDYSTLMSEDDILLTANAMFAEIFRRDKKGFYIGRPVQNRLNVTCRYVSVLTSAILKANNIPCRCRAGWARYLDENKNLDHWVNEYYSQSENRWIMFDMDDLYDEDFMPDPLYKKNKIAEEYLDFGKDQFYTASQMWQMYRKNPQVIKSLKYGSNDCRPEQILKYLFLDFWAVMNTEYNYNFVPLAYDKGIESFSKKELAEIDNLAKLMTDVDKNFGQLQKLYNTPKYRMVVSPLVGADNYQALIKNKKYSI